MFDLDKVLGPLATLTEADIIDMFGFEDAMRGRRLAHGGQVEERQLFVDDVMGTGIEAAVFDEAAGEYFPIVFVEGEDTLASECDCPRDGGCEHVAALLCAWVQEPASFVPETAGNLLKMLSESPAMRDLLAAEMPGFEDFLRMAEAGQIESLEGLMDLTIEELHELAETQRQAAPVEMDPVALEEAVRQLIRPLKVSELRKIARRRGFDKLKGTRKEDLIDQLRASLRATTGQPDFLAGLNRDEYETLRILNTLYGVHGYLTWNEIQWAWERHDPLKGGRQTIQRALAGLQEYGLLYRCGIDSHGGEEHFHWLPYLLGVRLPVVRPAVKTCAGRKVRRLAKPEAEPSVLAALAALEAFVERQPLPLREPRPRPRVAGHYPWLGEWDLDPDEAAELVRASRGLYPTSGVTLTVPPFQPLVTDEILDRLAEWLGSRRDFASWLTIIAVYGKILTPPTADRTPLTVDRQVWAQWYGLPLKSQLKSLFQFWRDHVGGLTELRLAQQHEPDLQLQRTASYYHQFSPTDLALELTTARGFVARLLQDLPVDVWYDWPSFAESARRLDSHFLHSYYGPDVWGFTFKGKKRLDPSRRRDWERGYRPVLAAFLEGPLRWLGVVEVGYDRSKLAAFRLTPTGAWLLREEGQPAVSGEADEAPVTWLNDRTFRVSPGPVGARILALADGVLATPTRRPFVYELSNAGVQKAFARGIGPTEIAGGFEEAGASLPQASRQRIEDLWSRFGYVHLYEKLTVLELADDLALRELLASTRLRPHIIHQFSPRLAVVEDDAVDALVEELIKQGYTPKVES